MHALLCGLRPSILIYSLYANPLENMDERHFLAARYIRVEENFNMWKQLPKAPSTSTNTHASKRRHVSKKIKNVWLI